MSLSLRIMTWVVMIIPISFVVVTLKVPSPLRWVMGGTTVFLFLTYASVWFFWRPTRFELGEGGLKIIWPVRARFIPLHAIAGAREVSGREFRREYGYGMRIGAGGLWGGFGLLKTAKTTFSMWISRTDDLVIVTLREGRPLLITPEHPRQLVEAIERTLAHGSEAS